jgi:diacylglycerol kinase (ATP)
MRSAAVVQLFFNPASGSYSPRRLKALTHALEAAGAEVVLTTSIDEVPSIVADATHICIAAGDGTVRHVASALARCGRPLPIAIYPSGTVNLLAMEGAYSTDPATFADHLLKSDSVRHHHPVAIGDDYFFACAGAGPDGVAIARLSSRLKRVIGRLAYVAAFLGVLRDWPRPRIMLEANGKAFACEAFYVAKGRYFAGRWSFAPQARVSDGLLHVVALKTARRRDYAAFIWTMLRGRDPGQIAGVISFTCKAVQATANSAVPFQSDGDIVGALPVTLTLGDTPLIFR